MQLEEFFDYKNQLVQDLLTNETIVRLLSDDCVRINNPETLVYSDVVLPGVENGEIKRFELQKKYELQPSFIYRGKSILPITYVADFYIEYSDGHIEVIDTKGMPDNVAKLKRKLFWFRYPDIQYRWLSYSKKWGGWLDYDTIQKMRRAEKRSRNKKEEMCDGKE